MGNSCQGQTIIDQQETQITSSKSKNKVRINSQVLKFYDENTNQKDRNRSINSSLEKKRLSFSKSNFNNDSVASTKKESKLGSALLTSHLDNKVSPFKTPERKSLLGFATSFSKETTFKNIENKDNSYLQSLNKQQQNASFGTQFCNQDIKKQKYLLQKMLQQMKDRTGRYVFDHKNNQMNSSFSSSKKQNIFDDVFKLPQLLEQLENVMSPDQILYEGELMKYNPGFKYQYVSRYCTLTQSEFKYFKNENMSIKHIFPLVNFKLKDIEKVERVHVEISVHSQNEKFINQFQFEIFLKEDKNEVANILMPHNYIEESKINIDSLNICEDQSHEKRQNRFNRQLQRYGGNINRRNLETGERKQYIVRARSQSEGRYSVHKHLMPKPSIEKLMRSQSSSPYKRRNESRSRERKLKKVSEKLIKAIEQSNDLGNLKRRYSFINKLNQNLSIPIEQEVLESKNPCGWIKNLAGIQSWTNRQIEWFMAEERLLFACSSDEECDRWVCILNWLISKIQ